MKKLKPYYVVTEACPNHDYEDYCHASTVKIKPLRYGVTSFKEASEICRNFIGENDLGSGNWCGGEILDENKKVIALVSYNGRVWLSDKDTDWRNRREINRDTGELI